MHIAATLGAA
jgi:hypothetical protein